MIRRSIKFYRLPIAKFLIKASKLLFWFFIVLPFFSNLQLKSLESEYNLWFVRFCFSKTKRSRLKAENIAHLATIAFGSIYIWLQTFLLYSWNLLIRFIEWIIYKCSDKLLKIFLLLRKFPTIYLLNENFVF